MGGVKLVGSAGQRLSGDSAASPRQSGCLAQRCRQWRGLRICRRVTDPWGTRCYCLASLTTMVQIKTWTSPGICASSSENETQGKTWMQSEFCSWQNSVRGQEPPKMNVYSVPAQETAKHPAKICWPPLSDIGAVTKPIHETGWNCWGAPNSPTDLSC